jgi:hypothetical protein
MGTNESKSSTPGSGTAESPKQEGDGPAMEPSGAKGDNPATAGAGKTGVQSNTGENKQGHLNPSAPEDANVTPGSAGVK